jgi:hypothetical protein
MRHTYTHYLLVIVVFFGGIGKNMAQLTIDPIKYYSSDSIAFILENNTILENPLTGGLNLPQISQVDLNNDGKPDLFVFDRSNDKGFTYINTGIPGNYSYEYAPQFEYLFDFQMVTFAYFRDFNRDGKMDLFTSIPGGSVVVYLNITELGDTILSLRKMGELWSRNNTNGPVFFNKLGARPEDFPVFDDLDGDGDLDYITYESTNGTLIMHQNEQIELGLPDDTLLFRMVDLCWGGFRESSNNDEVFLNCNRIAYPKYYRSEPERNRRHAAGSTFFSIDMDGDGDKEMIIGNGEYENLLWLTNGKSDLNWPNDTIISFKAHFPSKDNNEIAFKYTPALFHFDVDGDNVKDILAAPFFSDKYEASHNIWFLKNLGSDSIPDFKIQSKDFLGFGTLDLGKDIAPFFIDINKDGLIDLLVGVDHDSISDPVNPHSSIYRFDNIGTINSPIFKLVDKDFGKVRALKLSKIHVNMVDMDNDNLEDLIIGSGEIGKVIFLRNTSSSNNTKFPDFNIVSIDLLAGQNLGGSISPTVFDYNLDGYKDLIIGKSNGRIAYYRNNAHTGTPTFTKVTDELGDVRTNLFRTDFNGYENMGNASPIFYDLDGDNKPELICGNSNGEIRIWKISYNHNTKFPEVSKGYGYINAASDTTFDFKIGSNSKIAIAPIRNLTKPDILVGLNRGGFRFFSQDAQKREVGLSKISNQSILFSIMPNPSNDNIFLDIPENIFIVGSEIIFEVSDMSGKTIFSKILDSQNVYEPISIAKPGVYFGSIRGINIPKYHCKFVIVK